MKVVLVTDIYGINGGVELIQDTLEARGATVNIISPYGKERRGFSGEKEAYAAFMQSCGHEEFGNKVRAVVYQTEVDLILGFSAGASAVWLASGDNPERSHAHIIAFYPTRIRKYLQISPHQETTIIFPVEEKSLDVGKLMGNLTTLRNVVCLRSADLQHGFMNPCCSTFSQVKFTAFLGMLSQIDKNIEPVKIRTSLEKLFC